MPNINTFKVKIERVEYKNIFLLSDLHFGVRANSLEWLQNHMNYFKNFYIPYLKENMKKGDILFFLGDFFDNRQLLDINVLNAGIDVILELSEILPIHLLVGNHDIYKKYNTDVNSITAFKYIPNITIYEKPVIITNKESKILILPWIGNLEIEEKYVKENKYDYVFAHTNIAGFKYDNNRYIHNGANLTQVKGIKKLFSGHIHKHQEFKQFIYIGSPFHTKRSDIGNQKGVYFFDPTNNKTKFTKNTISPIFQRIKLEDILELTLGEATKIFNNNYSDIIVPDKFIHLFNLTKFIDILKDCKYKKIETVGEKLKVDEELSDIMDGVDIKDILSLLEMSIDDLAHQMEVLVKLKVLNKLYYEKASKEDINYLNN